MTPEQQKAIALAKARRARAAAQAQAPAPAAQPQVDPAAQPQVDPAAQPQDNVQQINDVMGQQLQTQLGPMLGPLANAATHIFGGGNVASGLNALSDTASFGVAPAISRGVQNALAPGAGDQAQQDIEQTNAANPAGVVAGTLAAIPVDMALAAPLAAAAPAVPALNALVRGGGTAGNLARLAGIGGATGALTAATHGGDITTGAVTGAALGPVAGIVTKPIASAVEKLIAPGAAKAWRYLANKLHESPDDLLAHVNDYVRNTGRQPSLQQIVSDHDAGVIAHFGKTYTEAGATLRTGAQAAESELPAAAQDVVNTARTALPAPPRLLQGINPANADHATLLNTRDAATDVAMNQIRQTAVALPQDMVDDINRMGVLGGRQWRPMQRRMLSDELTLDDADKIRRRLQKMNAGSAVHNPDVADLADELDTHLRTAVPEYGTLMSDYAASSRYADAFAHGASGAERGAASDAGLRAALATAEGEAGHRAGALARTAQQAGGSPSVAAGTLGDIARPGTAQTAFRGNAGPAAATAEDAATALRQGAERARQTAPGALQPLPDNSAAATNLATGVAESPIAPISAVRNVTHGIMQALNGAPHLTASQQREIANALVSTDRAGVDAAIASLRRAGVSDARIRTVQGMAAAYGAKRATSYDGAVRPPDIAGLGLPASAAAEVQKLIKTGSPVDRKVAVMHLQRNKVPQAKIDAFIAAIGG